MFVSKHFMYEFKDIISTKVFSPLSQLVCCNGLTTLQLVWKLLGSVSAIMSNLFLQGINLSFVPFTVIVCVDHVKAFLDSFPFIFSHGPAVFFLTCFESIFEFFPGETTILGNILINVFETFIDILFGWAMFLILLKNLNHTLERWSVTKSKLDGRGGGNEGGEGEEFHLWFF